jgi:hypothetical protein
VQKGLLPIQFANLQWLNHNLHETKRHVNIPLKLKDE